MPNLLSAVPVVILAWVPASTSGLIRKPTGATWPEADATADSICASSTDSRLNWSSPPPSASAISSAVLPTPEKTIRSGGIPAAIAWRYSPIETMSPPRPSCASVASTALLGLALTA